RRRRQPDGPDAGGAPRLAAGDVREQGRDRRNHGARDARDRRWPRDDRDRHAGGHYHRPSPQYPALRDAPPHHEGEEEAARERETGGFGRRRRAAAEDLERLGAAEAQGWRDGQGRGRAREQAEK